MLLGPQPANHHSAHNSTSIALNHTMPTFKLERTPLPNGTTTAIRSATMSGPAVPIRHRSASGAGVDRRGWRKRRAVSNTVAANRRLPDGAAAESRMAAVTAKASTASATGSTPQTGHTVTLIRGFPRDATWLLTRGR